MNWKAVYSILGIFLICGGLFFVPFGDNAGNATIEMSEVSAQTYESHITSIELYDGTQKVATIDSDAMTVTVPEGTTITKINVSNTVLNADFATALTSTTCTDYSRNQVSIKDPDDVLQPISPTSSIVSTIALQGQGYQVVYSYALGNPVSVGAGTYTLDVTLDLYI